MGSKCTRSHGSFVLNKGFNTNIDDKPLNELRRKNGLKSLTEQPASSKNFESTTCISLIPFFKKIK